MAIVVSQLIAYFALAVSIDVAHLLLLPAVRYTYIYSLKIKLASKEILSLNYSYFGPCSLFHVSVFGRGVFYNFKRLYVE